VRVAERSKGEQTLSIILFVFRTDLTGSSLTAAFFIMLTVGVLWCAGANGSLGVCGVRKTGRGSEASGDGGTGLAALWGRVGRSGDPRFLHAWRALSLLAAARSSFSSRRLDDDRKRRIMTLASSWSKEQVIYKANIFLIQHSSLSVDIKTRRYICFADFRVLRNNSF
jgi:hypothetical protein